MGRLWRPFQIQVESARHAGLVHHLPPHPHAGQSPRGAEKRQADPDSLNK
jgi:hypothetical protein